MNRGLSKICNPCQSSPSLTILVPSRFIIIPLVFFYFSKLLFPGFLRDFKVILYVAKTSYLYYLLKVTKDNLDAVLQQQIMDQFRKDNEALLGHLEQRKMKSLEDTKVIKSLDSTLSNIIDLKKLEYSYPTLFKTTICDFLFPIYDLTKDLIPFLRPAL